MSTLITRVAPFALAALAACSEAPPAPADEAATPATQTDAAPAPTTTVPLNDEAREAGIPLPLSITRMETNDGPPNINWSPGPPRLTFGVDAHDFGTMNETAGRSARLSFHNTGGETLVIEEVKTSCGCTTAELAVREYEPGTGGYLIVGFYPRSPGAQEKYVTLVSNSEPDPITKLTVRANVEQYLVLTPTRLDFNRLDLGQGADGAFTLFSEDEGYEIVWVRTNHDHVTARLAPPDDRPIPALQGGRTELIQVKIEPTAPWGPLNAIVAVRVKGTDVPGRPPIVHTARASVVAQVYGALNIEPDTIRFGVQKDEAFERSVTIVHGRRQPFRVLSATPNVEGLVDPTVEIMRISDFVSELVFRARATSRSGQITGTIDVRTDVAGEEDLVRMPIVGVVRH